MLGILNDFPEILKVIDPKTHRVLFVNDQYKNLLGKDPVGGLCYREFHDRDTPCTSCHMDELFQRSSKDALMSEFTDQKLGRTYLATDRIVTWSDGRRVLLRNVMDITDVKTYRGMYEGILAKSREPFMVMDLDGRIVEVNDAYCHLSGYPREEIIGSPISRLRDPDIPKEETEGIGESMRTGYRRFETKHRRKDGSLVDVEVSATFMDVKGERIGEFVQDITERKLAERELQKSHERYRTTLDGMIEGCQIIGPDWRYVYMNDVAAVQGKIPRSELLGRTMMEVYPGIEKTRMFEVLRECMEQHVVKQMENEFIYPDGSKNYFELLFQPVPEGVFILSLTITKRKRAEDALKESERKFRDIVTYLDEGYYSCTMEGIVLGHNPALNRILGVDTTKDLIGAKLPDFWQNPQDRMEYLKELMAKGFIRNYQINAKKAGGETIIVIANSHLVKDAHGTNIRIDGTFIDISDRARAEAERAILIEELKEKTRELEQVIYVSSHDLRSPLVNVQGFSAELKASMEDIRKVLETAELDDASRRRIEAIMSDVPDDLKYIQNGIEKMDTLLQGLLVLSRIGRKPLDMQQLDMNKLMATVINTLGFQIKAGGIVVRVGELPHCFGDRDQIDQVMSNLLDNAIKYLDPARPGVISINAHVDGRHAVYCVEDNGIGIDKDQQERVFEIFQRLHPAKCQGEGLGLTIVKKILFRHGGRIWLESEPGKGSKFYISLPVEMPRRTET